MKTRKKIIRGFLLGTGLMLAVSVLIYAWMVTRPTGYENFIKQNAPALRRVQAALTTTTLAPEEAPAAAPGTGAPTPPPARIAPVTRGSDFARALCTPDRIAKELAAAQLACPTALNTGIYRSYERFTPLNRAFFEDATGARQTDAALRPWIQEEARLAAAQGRRKSNGTPWARALNARDSPPGRQVAAALDQMEALLLGGRLARADFKDFPREFRSADFKNLAVQTVLRRARQGDAARAERLLQATLEASRALRLGTFPREDAAAELDLAPLLLGLAELDSFPDEALARAARVLDQGVTGEAGAAELRTAHLARQRDAARAAVIAGRVESNYSALKYLLGGLPDRIRYRVMQPLLLAAIDRLTVQRAGPGGGAEGADAAGRSVIRIAGMMGIQRPDQTLLHAHTNEEICDLGGAFALNDFLDPAYRPGDERAGLNRPVQLERLTLALARYRRQHHAFPERLAALAPEFLDGASAAELQKMWSLVPLGTDRPTGAIAVALIGGEARRWPLAQWRDWIAHWPVSREARQDTDALVKKGAAEIDLVLPEMIRIGYPLGK